MAHRPPRGPFYPGDHILLAHGTVWNQETDVAGIGSAAHPIVLDVYGTANRPAIQRNGGTVFGPAALTTGNRTGLDTALDGPRIQAGNVLRFEVAAGESSPAEPALCGSVSWAPAIGYVAG